MHPKYSRDIATHAVAYHIGKDGVPLSTVERDGFKHMLNPISMTYLQENILVNKQFLLCIVKYVTAFYLSFTPCNYNRSLDKLFYRTIHYSHHSLHK